MKTLPAHLALALALCAAPPMVHAAVPLRWQVETSRVQPVQFIAYHGENLRLAAALQSALIHPARLIENSSTKFD